MLAVLFEHLGLDRGFIIPQAIPARVISPRFMAARRALGKL
jgi:hypothetical protein